MITTTPVATTMEQFVTEVETVVMTDVTTNADGNAKIELQENCLVLLPV